MSEHKMVWRLYVDPDDENRPADDVLPKMPQFVDEHDTFEAAEAEAVGVLRKLRESDGGHGWHAVCYERMADANNLSVGIGEAVTVRLNEADG